MTCKQVRILTSAHPYVEYAPRELRAAEDHVAGCADCQAFRAEVRAFEADLENLPELALPDPETTTRDIMTRIAEVYEVRAAQEETALPVTHDWLPWGSAAGGLVIAWGAYASGLVQEIPQMVPAAVSQRMQLLLDLLGQGPAAAILLFGIMLYLAGLVAVLGDTRGEFTEKGSTPGG